MAVDVLVILGSKSDAEVGKKAGSILAEFGIEYEMVVASAHRTPDLLRDLIRNTTARVFIGVAGLSAALPGTIAAHTTKPVIGVPGEGNPKGGGGKAILAWSGGLDSTTAAVLAKHGLGDPLLAVDVDHGLMRKDETQGVARNLKELKVNHRILGAADEFFAALP